MANELTLSASVQYSDSEGTEAQLAVAELLASVSTLRVTQLKQNIDYSADEDINLGDIAAPGWAIFINRDSTNFIVIKTAAAGDIFAKLKPGEFCFLRLGEDAQTPAALADTAVCQLEILISAT